MSQVGLAFQIQGTGPSSTLSLSFDSAKFTSALLDHPQDVQNLFSGPGQGYATQLSTLLRSVNGYQGTIDTRVQGLKESIKMLDGRMAALGTRLVTMEQQLRAQFGALDKQLATMQQKSTT